MRATIFGLVQFWWIFTAKLESILSEIAEPYKLSPDACGQVCPLAPLEKPFALFFIFPRRISFFETEKGVFWWFDYCKQ